MVNLVFSGIGLVAIALFLVFCYDGFSAAHRNQSKTKKKYAVHELDSMKPTSPTNKHGRLLLLFLFTFTTASTHTTLSGQTASINSGQQSTQSSQQLEQQVQQLQQLVHELELRIEALEKKSPPSAGSSKVAPGNGAVPNAAPAAVTTPAPIQSSPVSSQAQSATSSSAAGGANGGNPQPTPSTTGATVSAAAVPAASAEGSSGLPSFLDGTTLNFTLDGYYAYNFNNPVGQMNQLRAYDLSSNSFSLNQVDIILDHPPDAAHGKRIGGRVDLMFGQATETLQGNANNELHPAVWRNLFQAYGTYVAPVGSGVTIDFGKWASALGVEGNYTKDQINYSRSFFFDFLPFYHMGFRTAYTFNPKLTAGYWLVNGAQQTDAFSAFKSQAFAFTLHPKSTLTWQINYFFGQQERSFLLLGNPDKTQTAVALTPTPNGREHIFDTYATWNTTPKMTLVGEADYVLNRKYSESAPQHVAGGAGYLNYQWTHRLALATRAEYLADPEGLYSGKDQALKESTVTADYLLTDGFKTFMEWRRDFSNQRYFDTSTAGKLAGQQTTITLGLVWWFGQMQGPW